MLTNSELHGKLRLHGVVDQKGHWVGNDYTAGRRGAARGKRLLIVLRSPEATSTPRSNRAPNKLITRTRCWSIAKLINMVTLELAVASRRHGSSNPLVRWFQSMSQRQHVAALATAAVGTLALVWYFYLARLNTVWTLPTDAQDMILREMVSRSSWHQIPNESLAHGLLDTEVSIYVYKLPSEFNTDIKTKMKLCYEMWCLEMRMHEFLEGSRFVTDNPEEADFFYVPVYGECFYETTKDKLGGNDTAVKQPVNEFFHRALAHIQQEYPFWNRSGGRDHIWMFPLGRSANVFPDYRLINNSIFLTTGGHVSGHMDSWAPFKPGKDICIPMFEGREDFWGGVDRDEPRRRKHFVYFNGDIIKGWPWQGPSQEVVPAEWVDQWSYSSGVRYHLWRQFKDTPGVLFQQKEKLEKVLKCKRNCTAIWKNYYKMYHDVMWDSKFCLAPKGWHPNSQRPFQALMVGCIPVIIADEYKLPFEDVLDWSKFSVRIPEKDVNRTVDILRGMTDEQVASLRREMRKVWRLFTYSEPPGRGDAYNMIIWELARKRQAMWAHSNMAPLHSPQLHARV